MGWRNLCQEILNSSSSFMRMSELNGAGNYRRDEAGGSTEDRYRRKAGVMSAGNNSRLAPSLIASCLIHAIVVVLASTVFMNGNRVQRNSISVRLVELPSVNQEPARPEDEEKINSVKKPPVPPKPQVKEVQSAESMATKTPLKEPEAPWLTSPPTEEAVKSPEFQTTLPTDHVPPNSTAAVEGDASETGAGNLLGQTDVSAVSGTGTAEAGSGTAASGLGRGRGSIGLPPSTIPFRTNREAKPLQTVRASYPPMALRMGVEGDVTLRIEIDTEGKVTKADILKSGGAAFDEEAVKAVKQARFEPANKDGRNVPAEFMYVYRFRLRK
jgi:TonB family protein